MRIPENLLSLHTGEEEIRDKSLVFIGKSQNMMEHLNMIQESMNHIYAHVREHEHNSPDELTLQLFGIRLFNAAGAAIKLAFSGYYQKGFMVIRDMVEVTFLLDYFKSRPEQIAVWKENSNAEEFKPLKVRKFLDERDGYQERKRAEDYKRLCEYAAHISNPGFKMIAPDGMGRIGVFFEPDMLAAFIEELAKKAVYAATVFAPHFKEVNQQLSGQKLQFCEQSHAWLKKFAMPETPAA